MIATPCIILGGTIAIIAALLLVEDEINYPVGGSGAGKRRAEKRAAEAADGASIFPSTQNRWKSASADSENGNVSGECVGGESLSFSAGEQFAHDVQAALFQLLLDGIISEVEYNVSAEMIRRSISRETT
jgi:hypothetical protein